MSDAVLALNREWRYTYINGAAERLTDHRREEMLGRTIWEVFPVSIGTQFEQACRRAMDEGVTVHFEEYYAPFERWFAETAYPSAEGITVYARDITDLKRAQETQRKS
jgi:PAS domain S-box-containing protein